MKTWLILFRPAFGEADLTRLEALGFRISAAVPPLAVIGEAPDTFALPSAEWPNLALLTSNPIPEALAPDVAAVWNPRFGARPFDGLNWDTPGFEPPDR